jgi:hypothetical protein
MRKSVTLFREQYDRLTYEECTYLLAMEFTSRKRPRAWMVKLLMGRMNRLRNQKFFDDIQHLRTWVFRHA